MQTIQSTDHKIYRQYSLQTIWSVSSFLQAIGLGISLPASPEKNTLRDRPRMWAASYISLGTDDTLDSRPLLGGWSVG